MVENFMFSLGSALPIFLVMLVGYLLKRKNVIDSDFVKKTNILVFYIALPIKLFSDVYSTAIVDFFDVKFILFVVFGILASAFVALLFGIFVIKDKAKLGAFIQGSFRGNFLYIGLSLMENITGSIGLKAPLAIALIIPLYNVLAVIILSLTDVHRKGRIHVSNMLRRIIGNPMIIAVILGLIASQMGLVLPLVAERTMGYFGVIATPLALLAIGASFSLEKSADNLRESMIASIIKLVLLPMMAVWAAMKLGFSHEDVILLYILFGVPTAASSYVMTAAMNGDEDLASNIIVTSTLLSSFSITLFIFFFRSIGYF